jgi:hypothetical protein
MNIMGIAAFVFLLIIAIVLFLAARKGWIDDRTVQAWAGIGSMIAMLAAMMLFVIPAATPIEVSPSTSAPLDDAIPSTYTLQPTYTPYPTLTPIPSPWLRLTTPEDNAMFDGDTRTAVILKSHWLPEGVTVDSFTIFLRPEKGEWFVLFDDAASKQQSLQVNFRELSGIYYWKVAAKTDATTHISEVRAIRFGP